MLQHEYVHGEAAKKGGKAEALPPDHQPQRLNQN
jgi:hypothetical protein